MTVRVVRKKPARRGAAVVELAVCLPVIFLLLMSSLEICTKIFLQESLTVAAYEAVIEAARTGGTTASAQARATAILTSRNVQGYACTVSPDPATAALGTTLTVTVTAPSSSNSVVPIQKFNTGTLTVTVKALKEAT